MKVSQYFKKSAPSIDKKKIKNPSQPNTIAIIGGGAASVSLCMQIVEELKSSQLEEPTEIIVFEKSNTIGPGLPYSKKDNCYILNLPKDMMEPIYGDSGKFTQWLKDIPECPQDTQFPPRYFFGLYLKFLAEKIQKDAANEFVQIKYYTNCEVDDVQENDGSFTVKTSTGDYCAHYIMLCTGHMPSSTYTQLIGSDGYYHDPWKEDIYHSINPSEKIVIIGSRLTAIDTALKLLSTNHKGEVIMVSRSGLLPTVLSKKIPPYALKYLTLQSFDTITRKGLKSLPLKKLLDLFWKEISEAEGGEITLDSIKKSYKDVNPLEWIKEEIYVAETRPKPWQQVLFSIYPIIPNIWEMLDLNDKKEFINKYKSLFLTYLAAFPLENAYLVKNLLINNQLKLKGGLRDITRNDSGQFMIHFEDTSNIQTSVLINATGPGYNPFFSPLYRNLIKKGLACKHHAGGINVDPQTLQLLNKEGKSHPQLFAVGEITWGACLATTDMSRVAIQSSRVATTFCQMRRRVLMGNHPNSYRQGHALIEFNNHSISSAGFFKRSFSSLGRKSSLLAIGTIVSRSVFTKN